MIIRKSSWHYWLYDKFSFRPSECNTNLCRYVQTILLGICGVVLVVCMAGVCVLGMGVIIYLLSWLAIHYLGLYALCLPPGVFLLVWLIAHRRSFRNSDTYQLVSAYFHAKKNRFCPTVKFTE